MGYYAIKENKSLGETMSKAEIEESIENLSDSVDTKEQELRNYADDIPVIDIWEKPESTDILRLVSQNQKQNKNRECLLINHTDKSITFNTKFAFDATHLYETKTFFYQQDFTKKTLTTTVTSTGVLIYAKFDNVLSIPAGGNAIFKYIAMV